MPARAPHAEARDEKALETRAESLKESLSAVAALAGVGNTTATPGLVASSASVSTVVLAGWRLRRALWFSRRSRRRRRAFMAALPSMESPAGSFTMLTMETDVAFTASRAAHAPRTCTPSAGVSAK